MSAPRISFIIVSYNTRDMLRDCLRAVYAQTRDTDFEVIVVDNASHDGSPAMVTGEFPQVRLIALDENLGFGAGNNVGAEAAEGDFLFLLNSDAILLENTAVALCDFLQQYPLVACVGPRIVWPNRQLQPRAFGYLPSPWRLLMQSLGLGALGIAALAGIDGKSRRGEHMEVGWLSGVCLCLRRNDYLAIGGFDPRFFMYAEDVALCGRLWRECGAIVLVDRHDVMHYGGASSPNAASRIRNAVWQQRHILIVCEDEYGRKARLLATGFVATGLLLRLLAASLMLPFRNAAAMALLQTTWARLKDLCGIRSIPSPPTGVRKCA